MRRAVVSSVFFVLAVATCSWNIVGVRPEALAGRYFASRASGDLDETLSLYGRQFYRATPRSDWSETLTWVESELGTPEDHSLSGWHVWLGLGPAGPGTYVTLRYDVQYSKHPGQETLLVFTPAWAWPTRVVQHTVDAPAFQPEQAESE
jgi:hypothetical protein